MLFFLLGLSVLILFLLIILIINRPNRKIDTLENNLQSIEKNQEKIERNIREEIAKNRDETSLTAKHGREEINNYIKSFNDSVLSRMADISNLQKNQLDTFSNQLINLTQLNEEKFNKVRETIEERLKFLQKENSEKLEKMRETVDEKLHTTLEKRLGESFNVVSDRLEQVYKGLGEMQTLAVGVGDLKKVLMNVKTRGTWGEVQLENLLEQMLTSEQYERNVRTKEGSKEQVDFAIKLPGRDKNIVWIPIDAKFPLEDYQKLIEAQDKGDLALIEQYGKAIENTVKSEAKSIKEKYIDPPNTTDFGILFLPIEGLYAEVLRQPGLYDFLQRKYRVIVAGPTTISALLNSLQMGFRTLVIEKRASEVWQILGAVKTEFGKFGDLLIKTKEKLNQASDGIDTAVKKTKTIEKKLRQVQELPSSQTEQILESPSANDEVEII